MTTTFIAELASARTIAFNAREALDTAHRQVAPLSPEMHALFLTRPAQYAECLRKVADIVLTIPALTEAVATATAALAPLEDQACGHCNGTGRYSGPTNATRRGVPYCFRCNGGGERKH